MYKTIFLISSALVMTMTCAQLTAQSFDASGTAGLSGPYLFRYVNFFNDETGNLTESCTLSGIITFDGSGHYTTSNTQLADSMRPGHCSSLEGGTYGVQSNGITQLDNPLYTATLFGTFSQPVVIASSTEDDYFDLFIAVQSPSAPASNGSLSGAFTVGTLDFLNSSATLARQGYFTLKADGNGNIAAFNVNGSAANLSAGAGLSQNVAPSTYALSGTTGGTVTFPGNYGDQKQIVSGEKVLYVSADGNWFVGGSATGSDMLFGFRAPAGTSSNSLLTGTYFVAGMEDYLPSGFLDATYGSINAGADGSLIWHLRFDDVVDIFTYDDTFYSPVTIGASGSFFDGNFYNYLVGANGSAVMLIGSNQQFSLIVGIQAPAFTPSPGVWIDPIGITNAANFTPITNAYAPGELVTLFGNFGVSTEGNHQLPVPTTLNGVQVLVNGQPAPVDVVSENQISVLMPYEVAGESFATFQVVVNGTQSNSVTVYVDNSAPGIYTLTENGIGPGAILHANFTKISATSPAKPGETVLMFMNGLGSVSPTVGDGDAGPGKPLSNTDEAIGVFLYDGVDAPAFADVPFAGLAPGFAGLYQVNFTLPTTGLANGDVTIGLATNEAFSEMATIRVADFSGRAVAGEAVPRRAGPREWVRNVRGSKARAKSRGSGRRALGERPR